MNRYRSENLPPSGEMFLRALCLTLNHGEQTMRPPEL